MMAKTKSNQARIDDLEWALVTFMDGIKQHEISEITGVTEADAQRIWNIVADAMIRQAAKPPRR